MLYEQAAEIPHRVRAARNSINSPFCDASRDETGYICATGLAATTISPGCTHNGKTYKVGENFDPTPCEHCFCSPDGRTPCAIVDCFFTPCVDAVNDPTKCCPTCPNGENCKHKDGTVIKKGDVYRPDAHTVCKCPTGFMFGSPLAICAMQAIDPVHTQVVS